MTLFIPRLETNGKSALSARKSSIHAATTGFLVKSVVEILTDPTLKHRPITCTRTFRSFIGNRPLMTADSRKWLKAREASHVSVVILFAISRKSPTHAGEPTPRPIAIRTQLVRW